MGEPMFLRVVRAAGGKGVKHEYVRVVEAYRQKGKTRHRTVLNLGRRDLLAAHLDLDKLMRLLHGETASTRSLQYDDVHAIGWCGLTAAKPRRQAIGRWCWWPIALPHRRASTGWHAGWRLTSYATAKAGDGYRPGAMTTSA